MRTPQMNCFLAEAPKSDSDAFRIPKSIWGYCELKLHTIIVMIFSNICDCVFSSLCMWSKDTHQICQQLSVKNCTGLHDRPCHRAMVCYSRFLFGECRIHRYLPETTPQFPVNKTASPIFIDSSGILFNGFLGLLKSFVTNIKQVIRPAKPESTTIIMAPYRASSDGCIINAFLICLTMELCAGLGLCDPPDCTLSSEIPMISKQRRIASISFPTDSHYRQS